MKGNRAGGRLGHFGLGMGVALLVLAGCGRQEAADWKQATLADSAEAYTLFLQQHPHSAESPQAQTRIQQLAEQRDWQIASAADTRDSYQLFLTQHSDSKWAQEARIRIENFAQAGVSGGAALASASSTPTSPAGNDAAANDASAPAGTTPGTASTTSATSTAGVAPAAALAAGTAGTAAPAAIIASTLAVHAAHREHTAQRARTHAHTAVAHLAHRSSERVARAGTHPVHAEHAHAVMLARGTSSARLLQLGAFHSRERAESEWRKLSAHYAPLRGLQPRYVATRSHSGRVYRLQVRVSSAAAASGVCASLKRHARSCVRVIA